jgi:para-aminobenzoate synthetase
MDVEPLDVEPLDGGPMDGGPMDVEPMDGGPMDVRPTDAAAAWIARWLVGRPAWPGGTRVLAVDGRSGAGKTTLARAVAGPLGAPVVAMDDLYDGWDGLAAGIEQLVEGILRPLARGQRPRWRRYDWPAGCYGPSVTMESTGLLVVEGVGAGARAAAPLLSGLVLVAAPTSLRRGRALARDGEDFAPHWDRWARHEERYLAAEDIAGRADILVNGALASGALASGALASGALASCAPDSVVLASGAPDSAGVPEPGGAPAVSRAANGR